MLPALTVHQFDFRADKVDVRPDDVESVNLRVQHCVGCGIVVDKAFVDRCVCFRQFHTDPRSGVGLRIGVDQQHTLAPGCQAGS